MSEDQHNVVFLNNENRNEVPKEPREQILNLPPVVKWLSLVLAVITTAMYFLPETMHEEVLYFFAFVPGRYAGDLPFDLSAVISPLTHQFIHAGFTHLAVNVAMLMAFGSALEKAIGGTKLLTIYFLSGIAGALVHALIYPHTIDPLIGASGAISGLFGAVVMWMYDANMIGNRETRGLRSLMPLVLVWIGTSVFFGLFGMPGAEGAIAWIVHIAGFIAGLLLFRPIVRFSSTKPKI